MIRLPRAVEERAMQMVRSSDGSDLSQADDLVVDHNRSKQHWVEFNEELLDYIRQKMDLVERSEAWSRVKKLFRNLERTTNVTYRCWSSMG